MTGRPKKSRGQWIAIAAVLVFAFGWVRLIDFGCRSRRPRQWVPPPEVRNYAPTRREATVPLAFRLPVVVLHTDGQPIAREFDVHVRARFYAVEEGRPLNLDAPRHDGKVSIHQRGYSTLRLPKPSYTVHLLDGQTNQTKVSLLGMPAEEDWVLYAPFEDKTLIRDVLAYRLTEKMGRYAPRTRFVELFVDPPPGPLTMQGYEGVYVLVEKIKRSSERVKLAKLEPDHVAEPEISGGYIIKRDHRDRPERGFYTEHGGPYYYVYPKSERITREQQAWLSGYFAAFEGALYGEDFRDASRGYAAYLDVDSFIDAFWLIELGKNVDGFRYSSFLVKDRGGKLRTEPPWDWNRSFGNANYYGGWQTQGWYWPNLRDSEISWYRRLREDPEFMRRCRARWRELRQTVFDPAAIHAEIDRWAAELDQARQRNFRRWPILGRQVTCNFFVGATYEEEVEWLKQWITERVAWIDGQVGQGE